MKTYLLAALAIFIVAPPACAWLEMRGAHPRLLAAVENASGVTIGVLLILAILRGLGI